VKAVLAAGKHVVCEKPLALTSEESGELLELAEASGLVHCTNYNVRFYPILHEADFPTFEDGHEEILLCDAIAESARTGTWVAVTR
jgi:predicted dehydrogenase